MKNTARAVDEQRCLTRAIFLGAEGLRNPAKHPDESGRSGHSQHAYESTYKSILAYGVFIYSIQIDCAGLYHPKSGLQSLACGLDVWSPYTLCLRSS